jgi:hypothetical protein
MSWKDNPQCPDCGQIVTGNTGLGLLVCPNASCGWNNEKEVAARGELSTQAERDLPEEERRDEAPGGHAAERPGEFAR